MKKGRGGKKSKQAIIETRFSKTQSQGFSQTVDLGEGVEQSIYGGGNKQDESRWKTFGKMGNIGDIIQKDNSAAHYFVLRDLGSIIKPQSNLVEIGC